MESGGKAEERLFVFSELRNRSESGVYEVMWKKRGQNEERERWKVEEKDDGKAKKKEK